jgi:hypothetical protein
MSTKRNKKNNTYFDKKMSVPPKLALEPAANQKKVEAGYSLAAVSARDLVTAMPSTSASSESIGSAAKTLIALPLARNLSNCALPGTHRSAPKRSCANYLVILLTLMYSLVQNLIFISLMFENSFAQFLICAALTVTTIEYYKIIDEFALLTFKVRLNTPTIPPYQAGGLPVEGPPPTNIVPLASASI